MKGYQDNILRELIIDNFAGDVKQAVKEFADKLLTEVKTVIKKHEADYKEAEKIRDNYKIGFYAAQEEYCLNLENSIDNLITELYGREE